MKLEDRVCSLENAQKLDELGVKAESYFWWYEGAYCESGLEVAPCICIEDRATTRCAGGIALAYTAAELGEMLPFDVDGYSLELYKEECGWSVEYIRHGRFCGDGSTTLHAEYVDTEADSHALMLIWLLENGHVKAEDLG